MTPLLVYILKVALLTVVFVLLYHLLLRRDTFHRTARIVLVSSLVISYILPFCVITIHKPIILAESPEVEVAQTPVAVPTTQYNHQAQPGLQQSQFQMQPQQQALTTAYSNHRQIDWIAIAAVIYALGVVILIALRLLSVQKVLRIIRRGRVIVEKKGCRIVISSDDIRPFSWMNSIVLPENMAQSESLWNSAVVRHEHSHVSHHHSIELLATDILSAFQWFNPAVWLLRHDLCCVQEFQADASVLDSGLDKLEYEQSLLSIATGGLSIPLVNGLGESYLRTRIRMMNRNHSRKGSLLKLIYLPVVLIAALFFMSNTVYDIAVNASSDPVNDVPAIEEPVTSADDILVAESENEDTPAYNEPAETDIEESMDADDPETSRTLLARYDESLLPTQVEIQSYPDYKELPQNLPDITLDSNNKQYPELNSLESIYDDGIITNDKPYKGYISCIQLSKGVYSFWVMGLEGKGGQVVSIELGTMDEAIAFLKNLVSSYKQGNTVHAQGHTLTGVRGNAYTVPRTDGVELAPYLVSVKNLKHDITVLKKRKNKPIVGYNDVGFFTEENKPDEYVLVNSGRYSDVTVTDINDGFYGKAGADILIERQIRDRAAGTTVGDWGRFNGVILGPLRHKEYTGYNGVTYNTYCRRYIPIIYDPEKYQAPLTNYQRGLKRPVFRHPKKEKSTKEAGIISARQKEGSTNDENT